MQKLVHLFFTLFLGISFIAKAEENKTNTSTHEEQVSEEEMNAYIQQIMQKNDVPNSASSDSKFSSKQNEKIKEEKIGYKVKDENNLNKIQKKHQRHLKEQKKRSAESEYEKLYLENLENYRQITYSKPFIKNGVVYYKYGKGQPLILCSVMHVSDIGFEANEDITSVQVGDSTRWMISVKKSTGADGQKQDHLEIKPITENLSSDLIVFTSKRNYTMTVKSIQGEKYFNQVSFIYDEKTQDKNTSTVYSEVPEKSTYDYRIRGDKTSWTPEKIITDGRKTYIKLPPSYQFSNETPTLYAIESDGTVSQVNYRFLNNFIVVDVMLDKAEMIENVGLNQEKIIFTKEGTVGILSRLFH